MMLIAVLAALFLDRVLGEASALRVRQWFAIYHRVILSWLPDSLKTGIPYVICLLIPLILIVFTFEYFLGDVLYGVFHLMASVAVLFFCLNITRLHGKIDRYLEARHDGEVEEATRIAEELAGEPLQKSFLAQSNAVTFAVFYHAAIEVFGIIFWFVLLGPVGALLYKTATLMVNDAVISINQAQREAADKVWGVLGWAPFRLVALTYFLAGSFDDAFKAWQKCQPAHQSFSKNNREIVIKVGCGALRHEVEDSLMEKAENIRDVGFEWIHAARQLVFRSAIIWLVVVAVLSLVK